MVTGEDLKKARQTWRIKKADVARHFDVDERTLTRWEKTLPESAEPAVARFLADLEAGKKPEPLLSEATDAQLLAQLAVRLERARPVRSRPALDDDDGDDLSGYTGAAYSVTAYAGRVNPRRTGT